MQRIDIVMDPATREAMLADMEELLGPLGSSGGLGGPGAIPGGGAPPGGEGFGPPAGLAEACADLAAGDSCSINESTEGTCMAFGAAELVCIPAGGPGGFPGGGFPGGGAPGGGGPKLTLPRTASLHQSGVKPACSSSSANTSIARATARAGLAPQPPPQLAPRRAHPSQQWLPLR